MAVVLRLRPLVIFASAAACTRAPAREVVPAQPPGIGITDALALGMVDGPSTASLTIVEAFDFTCTSCQKMQGPVGELVREYGGKVRVVFKNFVLRAYRSESLHLAACAAAKQGKFLPFATVMWTQAEQEAEQVAKLLAAGDSEGVSRALGNPPDIDLVGLARDVGLDLAQFESDRGGAWCRALVDRDRSELDKLGVDHLPVFLIRDKIADPLTKDELRAAIDAGLATTR